MYKKWQEMKNIVKFAQEMKRCIIYLKKWKNDIIDQKIISSSNYSQYRRRLLEKGLIESPSYNSLSFVLPRFKEFIMFAKEFE